MGDDEGAKLGKATVKFATSKALKVQLASERTPRWVPKSAIHDDSEVFTENSPPGELIVMSWFAEDQGLS